MKKPDNSLIVIFGASGDLTKRKLIPALFQLYRQGLFCNDFAVLGVSRTKYDDKSFRKTMSNSINEYSENKKIGKKILNNFVQNIFYTPINTEDADEYSILKSRVEEISREKNIKNIIYYLSTPPKLYEIILKGIKKQKLHSVNDEKEKKKIVIEKPFGYDLRSAKKLNDLLHTMFNENQIYRIDHYLGKETVQNILALRFSNGIYEPLWNRNYIDHVEITSAESIGVENRGGYYEEIGAMRDMVQNHMLQVASFIAMEPPSSFDADLVRNETFKVFQSLRRINKDAAANFSVRGQYLESTVKGKKLLGYREEENVNKDSRTETFTALKFFIDNWRWGGVPFYVRAGKRLPAKVTEVVIHFKKTPHPLFTKDNSEQISNMLVIRIQPDEGILLKFGLKTPGSGFKIQTVNMDFHYSDIAAEEIPTAYERLLLDCLLGDSTLFTRADAIEECWKFIDPIIEAWKANEAIKMYGYPAGTWGPKESFELFDDPDAGWRYPCKNLTDDGLYCEL